MRSAHHAINFSKQEKRNVSTEIIRGIIIGFFAKDWLLRSILPSGVGIIACVELFFTLPKNPLAYHHRKSMRSAGMTEKEIGEVKESFQQIIRMPFQESGMVGWKLYLWQFIWSSLTALPFSLISGVIKVYLIDR